MIIFIEQDAGENEIMMIMEGKAEDKIMVS